ncbi:MAG: hypothetical protein HZA03_08845 [Nitrospinae bacterium]|nr:hypothetical protein [Nitrospinota bacterium]
MLGRGARGSVLRARLLMLLRTRLLVLLLRTRLLMARLLRTGGLAAETGTPLPGAVALRAAAGLRRKGVGHQVHAIVWRYGFRLTAAAVPRRTLLLRGTPVILA